MKYLKSKLHLSASLNRRNTELTHVFILLWSSCELWQGYCRTKEGSWEFWSGIIFLGSVFTTGKLTFFNILFQIVQVEFFSYHTFFHCSTDYSFSTLSSLAGHCILFDKYLTAERLFGADFSCRSYSSIFSTEL